jgi:hypothetical protein
VDEHVQREPLGVQPHVLDRRRTGDDGVVVAWIARRFGDSLTPALRAAVPVRLLRRDTVVGGDDRLRVHGHLVQCAISEVDVLLAMAEGERHRVAHMAGIGRARGKAATDGGRHFVVTQHAGGVAVADRLVFAVPPFCRQPHIGFDVGVARGIDSDLHAAEPARGVERRRVGRDDVGAGDHCFGQRLRHQACARCGGAGVDRRQRTEKNSGC